MGGAAAVKGEEDYKGKRDRLVKVTYTVEASLTVQPVPTFLLWDIPVYSTCWQYM